ncbi:MAG: iron-containing alcohol dehydrogenase [Campylobacterales bacterium]
MTDFSFFNPTRVLFGRDKWRLIATESRALGIHKAMLLYGQGSVERSGLLHNVQQLLEEAGIEVLPVGGVKPNPIYEHALEAIKLAKEANIDAIIALGGGSVMDEAKGIAVGALDEGELWDFYERSRTVTRALPVITIPTLAATGSEMNGNSVLTRGEHKYNFSSIHVYPKLSLLSPELTMTISLKQQAYAAVDAISHIIEGYFTKQSPNFLMDELCEATIVSIMRATEEILANPTNYEPRAQFMWAATLALNGILQSGLDRFTFPNHALELPLSALFDIPHGAGLAIVIPAWMKWHWPQNPEQYSRFGRRLFGVDAPKKVIEALEEWFAKIGAPTRLTHVGITHNDLPKLAHLAYDLAKLRGGMQTTYTPEVCLSILERAL